MIRHINLTFDWIWGMLNGYKPGKEVLQLIPEQIEKS
jgi:hypothetical protein